MAKIREYRNIEGGLGGGRRETRVRKLDKDEKAPEGSEPVPADTPETDWEAGPAGL